jgi:hypothetical protein
MRTSFAAAAFAAASAASLLPTVSAGGTNIFNPNSLLHIDATVSMNGPINAAVADFQRDWYKVVGTTLSITLEPIMAWDGGCVLSLYQDNATFAPESFLIEYRNTSNYPELRVTAADMRGLIYGIYHVSGDFLGVDPFWFMYDLQPAYAGSIDVPTDYSYASGAPAFSARGGFFNDEDLLGFYYQDPLGESVYDVRTASFYAETVLRLRLNTIIPSTFGFPDERHYRTSECANPPRPLLPPHLPPPHPFPNPFPVPPQSERARPPHGQSPRDHVRAQRVCVSEGYLLQLPAEL